VIGLSAAVFAAFSAAYAIATPFGQAPDERAHFGYVQLLAQHAQLPLNIPERQQPPLYYLLAAILYKLSGSVAAVQTLSILCGAATVVVIALCARELWPAQPRRWVIGASLAGLLPQFQFIAASVSNDSFSVLGAAILTLLMIRVAVRPTERRLAWAIGLAFAMTLLAKETGYFLIVVVLLTLLRFWPRGEWYRSLLPIIGVPAVLAGWWFVRNLTTYGRLLPPFTPLYTAAPLKLSGSPWLILHWLDAVFLSFFALFGNMSTRLQPSGDGAIYKLLLICLVVIVVAGAVATWQRWKTWPSRTRWIAAACIVVPLVAFIQMVISSIYIDFQPQGRYLFVAGPLLAIGTVFAIESLASRLPQWIVVAAGIVLLVSMLGLDALGVYTVVVNLVTT
jgi:4-amino-4-deoxy-L-arabinose transferase-like glycosyltransferase